MEMESKKLKPRIFGYLEFDSAFHRAMWILLHPQKMYDTCLAAAQGLIPYSSGDRLP